jgi:error-prone DNA polymerase
MVHSWIFCVKNVKKYELCRVTGNINFSFLRGASHPEELVEEAAAYNYSAIAITDRNSLAGVVRAHVAAKAKGIKFHYSMLFRSDRWCEPVSLSN